MRYFPLPKAYYKNLKKSLLTKTIFSSNKEQMWSTRDPFGTLSQNESILKRRVERDEEHKLSGQVINCAAFPASLVLTLGKLT